jgi:hypothetical protein
MGDQPVARLLHTQRTTQTQNKRMPQVGFEPPTPVFKWAKMVHTLDHATTVIGTVSELAEEIHLVFVKLSTVNLIGQQ